MTEMERKTFYPNVEPATINPIVKNNLEISHPLKLYKNPKIAEIKSNAKKQNCEEGEQELTSPEIIIEIISEPAVCQSCKRPFKGLENRMGINICLLIFIIMLAIIFLPVVLLFLFLCKNYYVCPNCRRFTEIGRAHV